MSIQYTTDQQIDQLRHELQQAKEKQEAMRSHRVRYMLQKSIKIFGQALFYSTVVLLLFVLVSVLVTKSRGEIPSIFGFRMFIVESGSMTPTLAKGKVILSRTPQNRAGLAAGDIITFHAAEGTVVTHRIIEVVRDEGGNVQYRTKGDNPINAPDPVPVLPDNVIAVFVLGIPFT